MSKAFNILDIPLPPKSRNRGGIWKDQVHKMTVGQAFEVGTMVEVSCARNAINATFGKGWAVSRKLKNGKVAVFIQDPSGKFGKGSTYMDVRKSRAVEKSKKKVSTKK